LLYISLPLEGIERQGKAIAGFFSEVGRSSRIRGPLKAVDEVVL